LKANTAVPKSHILIGHSWQWCDIAVPGPESAEADSLGFDKLMSKVL